MEKPIEDIRVIGLGQACMDYLGRVPAYPGEDEKVEATELHIQGGGPASTAMVTLARLKVRTSFLGSISDDPFGIEILNTLKKEKVDTHFIKITPGYTSQFAFIAISEEDGKRTIFWHRGTVPHLKAHDVDLSYFPNARVLHVDSLIVEAALEAARQAKRRGLTVVMDGGTMRDGLEELLSFVDILIASEHFAEPIVGKDASPKEAAEALQRFGPPEVIITLGPMGSLGKGKNGFVYQEAFSIKALDTTGAGDVYHGAYIYGHLQGWEMPQCMRFASAVAGLKCREIGARKGIPAINQVKHFMGDSFPK